MNFLLQRVLAIRANRFGRQSYDLIRLHPLEHKAACSIVVGLSCSSSARASNHQLERGVGRVDKPLVHLADSEDQHLAVAGTSYLGNN